MFLEFYYSQNTYGEYTGFVTNDITLANELISDFLENLNTQIGANEYKKFIKNFEAIDKGLYFKLISRDHSDLLKVFVYKKTEERKYSLVSTNSTSNSNDITTIRYYFTK